MLLDTLTVSSGHNLLSSATCCRSTALSLIALALRAASTRYISSVSRIWAKTGQRIKCASMSTPCCCLLDGLIHSRSALSRGSPIRRVFLCTSGTGFQPWERSLPVCSELDRRVDHIHQLATHPYALPVLMQIDAPGALHSCPLGGDIGRLDQPLAYHPLCQAGVQAPRHRVLGAITAHERPHLHSRVTALGTGTDHADKIRNQ